MAVDWTEHRFAGGVLALDVANTVVLRADPDRGFDRFENPEEISRFAEVASDVRSEELQSRQLRVDNSMAARSEVLALREATDSLFRDAVEMDRLESSRLSALLAACAQVLQQPSEFTLEHAARSHSVSFAAAIAVSALGLLPPQRLSRLRTCGHCGWLFLDRSRNASRIWCDMSVCGNRRKAARHYKRRQQSEIMDV